MSLLATFELDLVELGDPINDISHIRTKTRGEFFFGDGCVFDHIVQDGRDDGIGVDSQLGQHRGGCERMGDVRFAGFALLAAMGVSSEFGGGLDALGLFGRQVSAHRRQQILKAWRA